ncbi:MAG: ROK family transcriptional regulator [Cardiobacteriaceae bacterium]|nr:ROK family transcriptional regulator [Cardiobacteriaceae bacterium]
MGDTEDLGKNPIRIRDHNRKIILDLLRRHGQLGRKELAEMTRLSAPAIGNILDTLLTQEFILDRGRLRGGRGQPALQFALNPKGAHTIGFEIGVNGIMSLALDLGGNPIYQNRIYNNRHSPEQYLDILRREQARIAEKAPGSLLGIGVVMPGPFAIDGLSGIGPTTLPLWDNLDSAFLTDALATPVWIENDANAAALAESLFGKAAHLRDFATLYFGAGIGLGIVSGGRLFRGGYGNAGEIGHIPVIIGGRDCPCGQQGCLERYVSRHALSETLGLALSPGTVQQYWDEENPQLLQWIGESAEILTPVIRMIENLLDPQTIIIGGQLPAAVIDALINAIPLQGSIATRADREHPRLVRGDTGAFTAALGAAALPMYDAITP